MSAKEGWERVAEENTGCLCCLTMTLRREWRVVGEGSEGELSEGEDHLNIWSLGMEEGLPGGVPSVAGP